MTITEQITYHRQAAAALRDLSDHSLCVEDFEAAKAHDKAADDLEALDA